MRKGFHTTSQGHIRPQVNVQHTLVAILLALLLGGAALAQQEAKAQQEQPQQQVEQPAREQPEAGQTQTPERQRRLLISGRRNVLARLMDQLKQQTRETEEMLRQGAPTDQEQQSLRAELQALRDLIGTVEQELDRLGPQDEKAVVARQPARGERLLDQRDRELTQRRKELSQAMERVQTLMKQLQEGQEERREQLQDEFNELQEQTELVDTELAELKQLRLRAEYREAMGARERGETAEQEEAERRAPALASRVRQLGQQQAEIRENMEQIRNQLQEMRELRAQGAGQWEEVHINLRRLMEQAQGAQEELERQRNEQHESARRSEELTRQQEELRAHIGHLGEQFRVAVEQAGAQGEEYRRELERLRTDLQRMGQTIGQIEHDRLDSQKEVKDDVEQLRYQLNEVRGEVLRLQGALSALLSQTQRSTVGSAGLTWCW